MGIDAQRGESPPRDDMTECVFSHDSVAFGRQQLSRFPRGSILSIVILLAEQDL